MLYRKPLFYTLYSTLPSYTAWVTEWFFQRYGIECHSRESNVKSGCKRGPTRRRRRGLISVFDMSMKRRPDNGSQRIRLSLTNSANITNTRQQHQSARACQPPAPSSFFSLFLASYLPFFFLHCFNTR